MIRETINKYIKWRKKCKIWQEHGNHTKFHFTGSQFNIGDWTYGVPTVHKYDDETKLTIGKFCSIAAGVQIILGGNHHTKWISTYAFYQELESFPTWNKIGEIYSKRGDIIIGNDVWIGRNVTILSGAKIGDGAVIGAGAVVAGEIPPYSIAVGNPIKVIKQRFSKEQIDQLLKIQWWNWPIEKINSKLNLICSESIEKFITYATDKLN